MEPPLVSVIVPVYNGERFLACALDSVVAQEHRPIDLIVVNDGSRDGSEAIARSYTEVRLIRQPNQGVAAARNAGIAAARGDFIAFLDQDDCWTKDKLRIQVRYLQQNPRVGYVLARQKMFLEPGTVPPPWVRRELLDRDQVGYLPGAMMVRRFVFEQIGTLNPRFRSGDDSDWFARAKDAGVPMAVLPDILLHRRIHEANLSSRTALAHAELLKAMKASIDRQRRNAGERAR